MYSRVITGAISGIESMLAAVEVDASKGMPGFEMVGQLSNEVREARERVRVALKMPPYKYLPYGSQSAFHRRRCERKARHMIFRSRSAFLCHWG